MRERFVRAIEIRAPVERVFAFHERSDAFALLVPPWQKVEIVQPPTSLAVGTRVVLRQAFGPVKLTWEAEHVEYEPGRLFADRSARGPFAYWYHRHRFEPASIGCRMTDEVEYALPGGALGALVGGRFVRREIDRLFAYRHEVTRRECELESAAR